ncbi:succinate dehydrogenase, hydrophobic membrane anchor protein [Pseudotabrizicola alkalilacus]|uniref:Succinate dehydrogenase hydrophobic membrane anchor subunit n=1 Tax=Pseudotabrizicola alkalilacus TaxID=2305252 RepID=A0A411Z142_9RHOB|nr:succinate dehydrogenase, hydrophobic membrane anchor protein [Pseudotabrizicola alkalilacus]RGP36773.1 succinate dehydrogenase, hydrophobic membrane anchor protein [Pseudotabrizicola alkalilacus]
MRYLTDRKRAVGKGASGTGTEHHWAMQVTAVGLALLLPAWLYIFGSALGGTQAEVVATFSRPFPAILTALLLVVGMKHFAAGAQMMIEDYARGAARKWAVILVTCLAWAIAATGLFALARMAL